MAIGQFLLGTPERFERIQRFEPNQVSALNNLLSMSQQRMQDPHAGFAPIQEQQMRNFQQNIIPSIAERFAGAGALNSSGFQGALGGAGADLASNLAALQSQYGLQNRAQSLAEFQTGMTPQNEIGYFRRQPGAGESTLTALAGNPELWKMLGSYMGGSGASGTDGAAPTGGSWWDRIKGAFSGSGSAAASAAPSVASATGKIAPFASKLGSTLGAAAPIAGPIALAALGTYGLGKGLNYLFNRI